MLDELILEELEFDEEAHVYYVNGEPVPSVTQVMKPLNDDKYSEIDPVVLANAAARGTAVHEGLEAFIKYGLEDVPEEYEAYFKAFTDWWETSRPEPMFSEVQFYHKDMNYAGTADFVCRINGVVTLVDFKTTSTVNKKLCGVQLEAYKQALRTHGVEVEAKGILHMKKDGKYKFVEFPNDDSERWEVFEALMTVRNYIAKGKRKNKKSG